MRKTEIKSNERRITARKGVAIELALVMLVAVFAMCSLLVSMAVVRTKRVELESEMLFERMTLDNIGETFCSAVAGGTFDEWSDGTEEYKSLVEKNNDVYTLVLCREIDG